MKLSQVQHLELKAVHVLGLLLAVFLVTAVQALARGLVGLVL